MDLEPQDNEDNLTVEQLKAVFEEKRDRYRVLGKEVLAAKVAWQNALEREAKKAKLSMKINAQVMSPNFPQTITLDVKASDTIASIKAKFRKR
jgi:hypothetical protein